MKRSIISLIILLFSLTMYAQKEYVVYDCDPNVKVFHVDTKTWDPLSKGETLRENDLLQIRQKGSVKLLDNSTRRIYNNVKTGKQSVASVVKASAKSADSTFGNLNRQLAKNVKNSDHRGKYYSTYGATMRGYEDDLSFTDSLYYAIFNGINNQLHPECLQLKKTINSDGTVSFLIVNDSDSLYYVTIVYGNSTRIIACFDSDIYGTDVMPIEPHSSANLHSFGFSAPADDCGYYLVASKREFWTEPLQSALRYMMKPDYEADPDLVSVIPAL